MSQRPAPQALASLWSFLPTPEHPEPATKSFKLPPRRIQVAAACNICRQRKSKCSGDRPTCRRCANHRLHCVYKAEPGETETRARWRRCRIADHSAASRDELLDILQNSPYHQALEVLERVRSGTDPESIVNHVKAGDALLQLAVSPETRYRYEFSYGKLMPENYLANNPYLTSFIYEEASLYSTNQTLTKYEGRSHRNDRSESQPHQDDLYFTPFHAAQVVEQRLSDVDISCWTTVCNDNVLMRELLAAFFLCEYQFTAAFQKDLFLEDMTAKQTEFCSSLLVNTVLAYCCVCYPKLANRSEYWNPNTLTYRFLAEAKRNWELEASEPQITTIQAGILFSVIHNLCGIDEIGKPYRIHALAMAHQIRLFDNRSNEGSERSRKGWAFLAWALYCWETLTAFSFLHAPLIRSPPSWFLPDPWEEPRWYGEIWVKYPTSTRLLSQSFCHVFHARCHFRVIMNDFCATAYSKGSQLTPIDAHGFWERLKAWYDALREPLLPKTIVLPAHLQIHIYYHHLVLAMFEPLVAIMADEEPSAQQIVADSKKYLQTLVRLYYLRHGFEAMDLFIVIPLMLTGYDCVDAINDMSSTNKQMPESELESLRSTLILIVQGLYSQRRNHYLAEALYRVIKGRMRRHEASLLRTVVDTDADKTDAEQKMRQAVKSHWPVSVVKKRDEVESHILTNLVKAYAEMSL